MHPYRGLVSSLTPQRVFCYLSISLQEGFWKCIPPQEQAFFCSNASIGFFAKLKPQMVNVPNPSREFSKIFSPADIYLFKKKSL